MKRAWAWVREHTGQTVTVVVAFFSGVLLGAVLGWSGPGRRSIDWGTAGEWIPGLLSGAATAGALWWAISQVVSERRQRERAAADSMTVMLERRRSGFAGDQLHLYIQVANYGLLPVVNLVLSAEASGVVDDGWRLSLGPGERRVLRLKLAGVPSGSGLPSARVWLVFQDARHEWWRREEGKTAELLTRPPIEGRTLFVADKELLEAT